MKSIEGIGELGQFLELLAQLVDLAQLPERPRIESRPVLRGQAMLARFEGFPNLFAVRVSEEDAREDLKEMFDLLAYLNQSEPTAEQMAADEQAARENDAQIERFHAIVRLRAKTEAESLLSQTAEERHQRLAALVAERNGKIDLPH